MRIVPVGNGQYVNKRIVSDGPIKLCGLQGYNSGAEGYLQVFNAADAANGQVPVLCFRINGADSFLVPTLFQGINLDTACTVAFSTTPNTLTLGAANCGICALVEGRATDTH